MNKKYQNIAKKINIRNNKKFRKHELSQHTCMHYTYVYIDFISKNCVVQFLHILFYIIQMYIFVFGFIVDFTPKVNKNVNDSLSLLHR